MPLERALEQEFHNVPGNYEKKLIDAQVALDKHDEKVQKRSWIGRIWHAREDARDRADLTKDVDFSTSASKVAWDVANKLQPIVERIREDGRGSELTAALAVEERDRLKNAMTRISRATWDRSPDLRNEVLRTLEQIDYVPVITRGVEPEIVRRAQRQKELEGRDIEWIDGTPYGKGAKATLERHDGFYRPDARERDSRGRKRDDYDLER